MPGKFRGQRSLAGYDESNMTKQLNIPCVVAWIIEAEKMGRFAILPRFLASVPEQKEESATQKNEDSVTT